MKEIYPFLFRFWSGIPAIGKRSLFIWLNKMSIAFVPVIIFLAFPFSADSAFSERERRWTRNNSWRLLATSSMTLKMSRTSFMNAHIVQLMDLQHRISHSPFRFSFVSLTISFQSGMWKPNLYNRIAYCPRNDQKVIIEKSEKNNADNIDNFKKIFRRQC
jgi:hypothetical protein